MKKMLLLLVCLTTFAWLHAEETPAYTFQFGREYNKGNAGGYTTSSKFFVMSESVQMNFVAFNNNNTTSSSAATNNWTFIRCGNKNQAVTATATTSIAAPKAINKIVINANKNKTGTDDKVTTATLLVASKGDFSDAASYDIDINSLTTNATDIPIIINNPAVDLFYQIKFVLPKNTNSGWLQINKISFYEATTTIPDDKVATPTFSLVAGNVIEGTAVTIACATEGATIYYTTDGTDPSASSTSTEYTAPIAIDKAMTIKAIAVKEGMRDSGIAEAAYTLIVATPAFDPAAGAVEKGKEVTITCMTEGAQIYYTTDGTEPTIEEKNLYTIGTPIAIKSAMTIKAIAVKEGYANSEIATARYSIIGEAAPAPQAFFDFTTPANFGMTGTEDVLGHKFNLEGVTVEFTQATGGNKPTFSSTGGYHVRVYKNATIVISVAEGQSIESIQFKGASLFRILYNDNNDTATAIAKSGETTANWWSPTLTQRAAASNEVVFTIDDTGRVDIKSINVNDPVVTGVEDVTVDENAPVEYYNLQGVRVANPENGIYIRRQGSKVSKVLVR